MNPQLLLLLVFSLSAVLFAVRAAMQRPNRLLFLTLLTTFSLGASAQSSSGVLAPARATDWTYAGLPGGIPSRTTICYNVQASDSLSIVQTHINSCAQDTVVKFPAGTWTGALYSNKGIVIRGAGPTQTKINLSGGNLYFNGSGTSGMAAYPTGLGSTNWTGGLTKGSTVLTLASTAGVQAGMRIVLDQHNAAWVFPDGEEGLCTSGNSCGRNDSPLQFWGGESRAQQEMVEVVSVDSGTQITIAAPGVLFDHDASLAPQAFYYLGPFGLLSEYTITEEGFQKSTLRKDIAFRSWQVQASYVLTGEKKSFGSPNPKHPFSLVNHGWGAWELAARTGDFRVDHGLFNYGFANPTTSPSLAREWVGGVNWYLNRIFRISVDYGHTNFTGGALNGDHPAERVFLTRFQFNNI